jgi:hypothetical protein
MALCEGCMRDEGRTVSVWDRRAMIDRSIDRP